MSTLLDITNSLQNFSNSLQGTLSDRLTNIQNSVNNIVTSNGQTLFSQTLLKEIRTVTQQYKAILGGTAVSDANVNGDQGNRVLFSTTSLYENSDYFTNLQTMDVHQVRAQGAFLTGLLGSKEPVLPMVFNVVYPDTYQTVDGVTGVSSPLYLFINPSSWQRSSAKVLGKSYIRNGIKTERWGEELEQISASGTCAAFFTQETGLTRFYRNQSPGFRNLMELVQVYRNNGCIYGKSYDGNDTAPPSSNRIIDVGFVEILYAYELFRGTFESFTITEDAKKPHNLAYSFIFNCSEVISIHDILSQSTDFYTQANGITIQDGQYTQEQIAQIQEQQQSQFNSNQAIQYNNINGSNLLNQTNTDKNQGNSKPLFKI